MVAANPQKLMGRNKKIQSEVDEQQQQLIAAPINIAVSQNILNSLAKITELISQQNSQIVEIIREVKQPKSAEVQPQQQLIASPGLVGPPGPPGPSVQPQPQQQLIASPGLVGPPGPPGPSVQPQPQPQQQLIASPADIATLQDISKSLAKITQLLTQQNSQVTEEANQERKNQENTRRNKIELGLENSFAAVKNVAQAVIAPVKNILDQIIQFFVAIFLGKALLNLIDWFTNPENQNKVRSIARFLKDWWPSLIAGYILFGTGFGRVVRSLVGIAARSVMLLGGVALKLTGAILKATKLKKIGTALSALGGSGGGLKGILAKLTVGAAVGAGGAMIAKNMMGGGGEEAPQLDVPAAPELPVAEAFGGGLIDFKTMLAASGGQVDSKLGIFAQLFGSGGLAGLLHSVPGSVSGPKGIDKVPAMLTDGEFVMSRGAVQKFGVNTLESMNAAGGGTNRPKIVSRKIYADGGGLIGLREKYDAKNGPGAYDAESARRRAAANAAPLVANTQPPVKTNESYVQRLREKAVKVKSTPVSRLGSSPSMPNIKIDATKISNQATNSAKGIVSAASGMIPQVDNNKLTPKQQKSEVERNNILQRSAQKADSRKQARSEYNIIINNMDHPDYQKAWDNGPDYMKSLQSKYDAQSQAPTKPSAKPTGMGYTPYQSRFAGARDAAHQQAKGITGETSGFSVNRLSTNLGNIFSGPRMQARQDYATSKGKYYSSSDKKTYANENDAKAAKQSRMTSLASQQRLDKLSYAKRSGQYGLGVREEAERISRKKDFDKRGGLLRQAGRGLTSMFGSQKDIDKNKAQDKAAQVRTKQAGAESIGKYYSSSDGKYYGNYEQAQKARKARLGKTSPNRKQITPTPKPAPKVITASQSVGGRQNLRGGGSKPRIPPVPGGKSNTKTKKQLGIK
jgi:hypothetical protein